MQLDEYVLGLLAIISGLAISEMVAELHRLLFSRKLIAWDWLAPLTAFYVALCILASWWVSWASYHDRSEPLAFGLFLVPVAQLIALFLAARGILPASIQPDPGSRFDLAAHYFSVKRYVWLALAVNALLLLFARGLGFLVESKATDGLQVSGWVIAAFTGAYLLLAWSNNRWLHRIAVPLMVAWFLATSVGLTIAP